MTLTALLSDLYRRLRYTTAPPAAVTTRLTAFLNDTQREILTLPGIARLREDQMPVVAVANKARTGLPPSVARIRAIVDRTNNHKLVQVPLSELRALDPAQAFTGGYPLRYAVVGYAQVQFQPAVATGLWVVSSSANDITQKAFVEGIRTGGYHHVTASAGTGINGLTRVALGTATDLIEVNKFYLDLTTAVGSISLYDAAVAGNELARIEPGQAYARYLVVEWFPIQTADITDYADYTRTIFDLVNGTDEPMLPPDFHYVVGLGARVKEYEMIDDDRLTGALVQYRIGLAALKSWVMNDQDRLASLRPTRVRWSQLGPMYPAGS